MLPLLLLGGIALFIFRGSASGGDLPKVEAKAGIQALGDPDVKKGDTVILTTEEYDNIQLFIKELADFPTQEPIMSANVTQDTKLPKNYVVIDSGLYMSTREKVGTDASPRWWTDYKFEDGGSGGFDFSEYVPQGVLDYLG